MVDLILIHCLLESCSLESCLLVVARWWLLGRDSFVGGCWQQTTNNKQQTTNN